MQRAGETKQCIESEFHLFVFLHGMPSSNKSEMALCFSRRSSNVCLNWQYMIKSYVFSHKLGNWFLLCKNMQNHIIDSSLDRICGSNFQVQLWCGTAAFIWLTTGNLSGTFMCIERFGCSQHCQSLPYAIWETEGGKDASAALPAWIDFVEVVFLP